jgi:phospholipid/cholesterol/gamma-HCH transport system substrate-binding protein
LVTVGLWLSATRGEKDYVTYVAYVSESVSGLNTKAAVKYRGVNVGQVNDIALDRDNPERVRLLFDIERGTPIKQDTVAVLSTQGITGLAYIDLTGGSRRSPSLEPSPTEPLPEIKTGPSLLVRLDTAVSAALNTLSEVAIHLNDVASRVALLLSASNQQSIAQTLTNVERLTSDLTVRLDGLGKNMDNIGVILHDTAAVSAQMPALMQEVQKTVTTINRAAGGLDRVLQVGQQEITRFSRDTSTQVDQALYEVKRLGETLRRLVQQLERNPNMLLLGRPRPQLGPGE